eukprot:6492006-Amphidinium_carterae.2
MESRPTYSIFAHLNLCVCFPCSLETRLIALQRTMPGCPPYLCENVIQTKTMVQDFSVGVLVLIQCPPPLSADMLLMGKRTLEDKSPQLVWTRDSKETQKRLKRDSGRTPGILISTFFVFMRPHRNAPPPSIEQE